MTIALALVSGAAAVGAVHTIAPDHWVPFAALARAERWPASRTVAVTAACGLGHVTVSVVLGLLGLVFGVELLQAFGKRLEGVSGLLLIGFGVAYALWGLQRTLTARAHTHAHAHGRVHAHRPHDHLVHDATGGGSRQSTATPAAAHRPLTAWTLFVLFSADPCVAVIPLMFAAAPLGWGSMLAVVAAYEAATIGTMVLLVVPARAAAATARGAWADRWGDALAGGVVATIGVLAMIANW